MSCHLSKIHTDTAGPAVKYGRFLHAHGRRTGRTHQSSTCDNHMCEKMKLAIKKSPKCVDCVVTLQYMCACSSTVPLSSVLQLAEAATCFWLDSTSCSLLLQQAGSLLAPVGVRWVEGRAGLHAAGRGAGRPTSTEQVACGSRGLGFIYCGNKQGREKTVRTQTLSAAARDR